MEFVMRLSVCPSLLSVLQQQDQGEDRWQKIYLEREVYDAMLNNSNSKMGEREKARASVERESERERERERERGQSQRLDSGLNVVSAIRLAGNPKMC